MTFKPFGKKSINTYVMNKDKENMEWEMEAPKLASLSRITPYQVPNNYFDDLNEQIMAQIKINAIAQESVAGFKVPENYFDESYAQIMSRASLDAHTEAVMEVKEGSVSTAYAVATDYSVPSGYSVPDAYFDKLNARILAKTTQVEFIQIETTQVEGKKTSKIFKLWQNDVAKYAAAACFVLISAVGLYFNNQSQLLQEAKLAELSKAKAVQANRIAEMQSDALLYNIDEYIIVDHLSENEMVSNLPVSNMATSIEIEDYLMDNYSTKDLSINY